MSNVDVKFFAPLLLLSIAIRAQAACESMRPENFGIFFSRFAEQKPFSTERTIYPTYTLRHEYGLEGGKEVHSATRTPISKLADASAPTINETVRKNGMQLSTQLEKTEEVIVKMEKPDTDWLLTYHFGRHGNCWLLHHIEDHSL